LFLKFLKYFIYILITYILITSTLLPFLLKPQLSKIIMNETNTKVTIESLSFNPIIFQMTLNDFRLKDLQGKELIAFKSLRLNLDPSSLFIGAFELRELALIAPKLSLIHNRDKSFNITNILKPSKKVTKNSTSENFSIPHIIIDKISLEGGEVSFSDYTQKTPFHFNFENIGLLLSNLDTKKINQKSANFRFYTTLSDGGFIDFKSKILDIEPFKTEGTLDFEASKLYSEWKYFQDMLNLEVANGRVSLHTHFSLNLADLNATQLDNFEVVLRELRIKPKGADRDILNLQSLKLSNGLILPMQESIGFANLTLNGLDVRVQRNANQEIDWTKYIALKGKVEKPEKKTTPKKDTKNWKFKLDHIKMEKISVLFLDGAIRPKVTTKLNRIDINATDITLLGKKPLHYRVNMLLNDSTKCNIDGSFQKKEFHVITHAQCSDFDIVHYRPYITKLAKENLRKYDLLLKEAFVDLNLSGELLEKNNEYIASLSKTNIALKKVLLYKKSTHERLLQFQDLKFHNIKLNSKSKNVSISAITLNRIRANIRRQKSGKLNVDGVVLAKVGKKIKKKVKKSAQQKKPYHVKIHTFALNNAAVNFIDQLLPKVQKQRIDRIYLKVKNIDSKKRTWLNYTASMHLNKKGRLKANGWLRHTPLRQKGTLLAKNIPLIGLTPYLQESSYIKIDDGFLSFNFKEIYMPSKIKPDLKVDGSLKVNSLFTTNTNDQNNSLFSLNELEVKPFTLELFPNRLYIDQVILDSFYVSAKIDENKTMNFAKLMKQRDTNSSKEDLKKKSTKSSTFPVTIVGIDVQNGSAEFEDLSLPIKFKTNIHDLQGVVYAVSNTPGGTTYLNLDGEVDKYGSTKLKGSVDSFHPKEYTDLNLNFKNLDLPAMSGYSASFAGYEIAAGKLYLDLGYEIMDGKLHATNNILIKHMKLGPELEGENINHLPLGLVVGLLEDSDGIIDIDVPIEGDVNKPDFKYGALVWKTLGNLITKAVTSPFKFLGSVMGIKGDELEYIAFEFGKAHILPPEREKLDNIVKMMIKRPKIVLKVDATYDEVGDLNALKLQKLVKIIMKKSGAENVKHAKTALTIEMLEDVYDEFGDDKKLKELQEKLYNKYKDNPASYKRAYQQGLIVLCRDTQKVNSQELLHLAEKRASAIKSYLVVEKGINALRVNKGELIKVHNAQKKEVHVKLNIDVKSEDK